MATHVYVERAPADSQIFQSLGVREMRGLSHRRKGREGPYTSRALSKTRSEPVNLDSGEVERTATEQSLQYIPIAGNRDRLSPVKS